MSRRGDPVRLAFARREGHLHRLMSTEQLSRESAELWERAWYTESGRLGLLETDWNYWERGLGWIAAQRSMRKGPG
jgi:hypothetical protein